MIIKTMNNNTELYALRGRLSAFIGQLTDLEQGFMTEIVITKGQDAELLKDILEIQISKIDTDLKETIIEA